MTHSDHDFTAASHWQNAFGVPAQAYRCGYCSSDVGSGSGWTAEYRNGVLRICPTCNAPTFFDIRERQWPGAKAGSTIAKLPADVKAIHEEARSAIAANAPTSAAMLCRKILMHVAVEKGAKENQTFQTYVSWLIDERYAPRGAEDWLEYIRSRANEANHEIMVMSKTDATAVLLFTEALLRSVYELPSLVPAVTPEQPPDETDTSTP